MTRLNVLIIAVVLGLLLNGCAVILPHGKIPPGQIKKQTAPGQMKKH